VAREAPRRPRTAGGARLRRGTNLQALIDACRDADYGARVVAVGADRGNINGLARAERAGIPTFVIRLADYPDREEWDAALARACAG